MKKIIIKAILFILLVILCDRIIGAFLSSLFNRAYEGDFGGKINLARKIAPDVLILGSSRAENHYIPKIIANDSNLKIFNTGIYGQSILYQYGVLQLVCEKHVPKIVILDIRPRDLYQTKNDDAKERLYLLLPFRKNNEIEKLINMRGPFESIKNLSKIYPFNSMVLGLIKIALNPTAEGSSAQGGYTPLKGSITDKMIGISKMKLVDRTMPTNTFDPIKLAFFQRIIDVTVKKKIKLILIESPSWYPEHYSSKINDVNKIEWTILKNKINLRGIDVINLSNNDYLLNKKYFSDFYHLNDAGARIFSKKISGIIASSISR